MKNSTIVLLASSLITIVSLYFKYRKKDVGNWMQSKRIDEKSNTITETCSECGGKMKRKTYVSGHRKNGSALVCENYPDCTHRLWGK